MKKKAYEKPSMEVTKIQQQHIICTSPYDATPPNEIPDYDDWMG